MNVFFLSVDDIYDLTERSIYLDLAKYFINQGHFVTIASLCEKRNWKTIKIEETINIEGGEIYKIYTADITKNGNYFQKGMALIELLFKSKKVALKAMKSREYDLILFGSPPVTFYKAAEIIKIKQSAFCYLLLKDIWPYDCRFDGILEPTGWKDIAFKILKKLARKMYQIADKIGCMSPANIQYLKENEPKLDDKKIEVNPNSVEPFFSELSMMDIQFIRKKYGIPTDKVIFVYGGNLGQAQGIDFALESVKESQRIKEAFFVFVGNGTEKGKIEKFIHDENLNNFLLLPLLPKNDYEILLNACDVGLVYLNHSCLSPNFPSRILSYMQAGMPIIFATDIYTDVGQIAQKNDFGIWCESTSTSDFVESVYMICDKKKRLLMGEKSRSYMLENYTVKQTYDIIVKSMESKL